MTEIVTSTGSTGRCSEKAMLYIQAMLEKAVPYIQSWAVVEEVRAVIAKARGVEAEYGE